MMDSMAGKGGNGLNQMSRLSLASCEAFILFGSKRVVSQVFDIQVHLVVPKLALSLNFASETG
jgi:hypothetical protein